MRKHFKKNGKVKEKNQKFKGKKDVKGSTKMEISTWKNLTSRREKIGKSDFTPSP